MRISESDFLSFFPAPSRGFLKADTVLERAMATAPLGAGVKLGPAPPEMNTEAEKQISELFKSVRGGEARRYCQKQTRTFGCVLLNRFLEARDVGE